MNSEGKKQVTLKWLKDNRILFTNDIDDKGKAYLKETKTKKWQFDMFDNYMDIQFSTWDKQGNMKSLIEMFGVPFASNPSELNSLMDLVGFKTRLEFKTSKGKAEATQNPMIEFVEKKIVELEEQDLPKASRRDEARKGSIETYNKMLKYMKKE